jgi:multidrug resistance efflux pump
MDIPRPPRRRALSRALWVGSSIITMAAVALVVSRVQPKLPSLSRSSVWTGRVERSPFVIRVRGSGKLEPESIRWLTTESSGRVEEVLLSPGMSVEPSTPIVRLENLDLRLQAVQASRDVRVAEAELLAQDLTSRTERLELAAELVGLRSQLEEAQRRAEVYAALSGSVVSQLDGEDSQRRLLELRRREALASQRLDVLERITPRQRLGLEHQLQEGQRVREVRIMMVERLLVRASADGILQDVLVELGQWVVPGTAVAKVIVSRRLQAELQIPAEQAVALQVGQAAQIQTGYGQMRESSLHGHVRRVAPAANQGTVAVEVALDGDPPDGVRPDQNVDGTIETERTAITLHLARPVGLALAGTSSLFRVDPHTGIATRVEVQTGRISVDSVEILSGLSEGDEVILSDMSRQADHPAVMLD